MTRHTVPTSVSARRPLAVLAILPQLIPSTLIGVVKPLLALHREGRIALDVQLEVWVSRGALARADVVVFARNTESLFGTSLETALALGKPIVYELDDNLLAVPPDTPGSAYHRDPVRRRQLERYLRSAALVRVYSDSLRAAVAAFNPHVVRVDGLVDWDLVPPAPLPGPPGPLRIVYATSRGSDRLAAMFVPDLRRILDAYRGRVTAVFWGYHPPELAGRPDTSFVPFVQDYDTFFRRFAHAGFDIGLAPLPDDEFHRAKSDNKFREYAASRIAGIYSDVEVYRDRVTPGRTGLLVPAAPGAWFGAMAALIENDALRAEIQHEAWTAAQARYGVAQAARAWLEHLGVARHAPPPDVASGAPGPAPGLPGRIAKVARRALDVMRRKAAPGTFSVAERVRWHLRSVRALMELRRELARAGRRR